jgi:hypothetical protein
VLYGVFAEQCVFLASISRKNETKYNMNLIL